ncbi:MAG: hypothetical protein PHV18_03100 [Lachnospiraceae bacterium]|nr:hypothetical protein [Lachnospiraceae bacterium]
MKKKTERGRFPWRLVAGCVAAAAVFCVVVSLFLNGIFSILHRAETESAANLQAAMTRASVQCYAIEGRYPPSAQYLEEEYGVSIDRDHYAVFYHGFASNIMPEITVVPLEGEQES